MAGLLESLGFNENPFSQYAAENEPHIDRYFVQPPYFSTIQSRAKSFSSYILFGARGAGKSATRIALYKEVWASVSRGQKHPLVVTFDTFSRVLKPGLDKITTKDFIQEVGFLIVEAVLLWLAALTDEYRETYIATLQGSEEQLVSSIVNRFYVSHPEHVRQMSAGEAAKLLGQAWTIRTVQWMQKKADVLGSFLGAIVQALAKKAGLDASIDKQVGQLISSMSGTSGHAICEVDTSKVN